MVFSGLRIGFGVARLHLLHLLGGDRMSDDGALEPIRDRLTVAAARRARRVGPVRHRHRRQARPAHRLPRELPAVTDHHHATTQTLDAWCWSQQVSQALLTLHKSGR